MKSRAVFLIAAVLCAAPLAAARAGESARPDPAPVRSTPFPDVPRNHWAFDAVEQLRQRGILRGYPPAPKTGTRTPSTTRARAAAPQKNAPAKPRGTRSR